MAYQAYQVVLKALRVTQPQRNSKLSLYTRIFDIVAHGWKIEEGEEEGKRRGRNSKRKRKKKERKKKKEQKGASLFRVSLQCCASRKRVGPPGPQSSMSLCIAQ